jgi:putative ABC transport system ATP-binding protein
VTLELNRGDFVTVLGSNGAGKSTLFNAIAGTFLPDSGSIFLEGSDITRLPDYKRSKYIGRLFQDPLKGTAPNMTIEENLALAYMRASSHTNPFSMVTRAERREFKDRLAQLDLGLEDRMEQNVGLLSGGQRQALTLLMATLVTPKLLLLDEHTAALDPGTAEKVLNLTRKIVAENQITCLMITHNIPSALALGNRTIMMGGGKIVAQLEGEERSSMTAEDLLRLFHSQGLSNDRVLFSTKE